MEAEWQADILFNGMTANAFKLGTVLSLGWFWMRPSGCMTIYRGQDGDIDFDTLLAVMDSSDEQIAIGNQYLPANSVWHYVRCVVSGCGLMGDNSDPCVVKIDENGDMFGKMPNTPLLLRAEKEASGKIRLRWRYSAIDQETAPTGFNVYIDTGSGFDYDNPIDTVAYDLGKDGEFTWLSAALTNGQLYRFIVRSGHVNEAETRNTAFVAAIADSAGPSAITGITSTWEEV